MAVEIMEIRIESCPAVRLIGKRYAGSANWEEWRANGWSAVLEKRNALPTNENVSIGAVHVVNGAPEYWIGMFFSANTEAPDGLEYIDIEPLDYAVLILRGEREALFGCGVHAQCLDELKARGLKRKEDDWCFQRYRDGGTASGEDGKAVLDYAVSIEK